MRLHVDSTFLQVERTLSCKLPQLPYLKAPGHLLNTYVLIMRSFLVEPRRHCQKTCSQAGILSELCFLFCEVTGFAVELNVLEVQWTRSEQSLADCFGAGCWRRGELIFGDLGLLGQKDRLTGLLFCLGISKGVTCFVVKMNVTEAYLKPECQPAGTYILL